MVCTFKFTIKLCRLVEVVFNGYSGKLLQAVMSLAFFGFLKVSESAHISVHHSILLEGCPLEQMACSKWYERPAKVKVAVVKDRGCVQYIYWMNIWNLDPNEGNQIYFRSQMDPFYWQQDPPVISRSIARAQTWRRQLHVVRIGGAFWAATVDWADSVIWPHNRWHPGAFL